MYIYIYIYIFTPPPPPPTTDPGIVFPVCPGRGRKTNTSKFLEFPKIQKTKKPKSPTQASDFWKLERGPQNPKIELPLEFPKFQQSKNSNPSCGFLETRAGACLSRKGAGDPQSKIPRVSKNPKTQKTQPKFRILGNSSGSLKIQKSSSRSSFQKSKPWGGYFGLLDFWKLERQPQNPRIELPLEFPKLQKSKISTQRFGFFQSSKLLCFRSVVPTLANRPGKRNCQCHFRIIPVAKLAWVKELQGFSAACNNLSGSWLGAGCVHGVGQ